MICALCGMVEFRNNYPHEAKQSFWLWQWERLREGLPQPPPGGWKIAHMKTDPALLKANRGEPAATWIGHATFLLWGGWVIEGAGLKVIHSGDLGYSRDALDIGARLGPFDLALIPIGAYAPRWFMKTMHVNPAEAVQVRSDLRARRALAMHWGTFQLTDEPLDEPPVELARSRSAAGLAPADFDVMKIGETRSIDPLGGGKP